MPEETEIALCRHKFFVTINLLYVVHVIELDSCAFTRDGKYRAKGIICQSSLSINATM